MVGVVGEGKKGGGVPTVLKYSIDFTILPFSSGINNIPSASRALTSAFFPSAHHLIPRRQIQYESRKMAGKGNIESDIQLWSRSPGSRCYMYFPSPQFRQYCWYFIIEP